MTTVTALYLIVLAGGAALTVLFIVLLFPILQRHALARPNNRSSHIVPTPQGGGVAVIAAVTIMTGVAAVFFPAIVDEATRLAIIFFSVVVLAIVGATDDIRPLGALPRLLLQAAAVIIVVATLPNDPRILTALPLWLERVLTIFAMLWLVNLVNFMDGIDWMTVVEIVPVSAALAFFGMIGNLPESATFVAIALCGAMIGFAPFNKPVARLFLGDVGSLPIGLLLGWLLILLAGRGHLIAAILLPLYYLADATVTLLLRLFAGEKITEAHRRHFYQRALDGGLSVYNIIGRVFFLNVALAGLATITIVNSTLWLKITSLTAGVGLVAALLLNFSSWRR